MNEVVSQMLGRYPLDSLGDRLRALREVLQQLALLGLWRARFYEHAAFYGGTALRVVYGLDRFSEDLDFSLLASDGGFGFDRFNAALQTELRAHGFEVHVQTKVKARRSAIQSAFIKADTRAQLIEIRTPESLVRGVPPGQTLRIKVEVDTDPPGGFSTEVRYLLSPIPFAVRVFALPDLFAGKMHAVLCRRWRTRVKGRDWYDLVWYAANHPELNLAHLGERLRQSGHREDSSPLTADAFRKMIAGAIDELDVKSARDEVEPFVKDPAALSVWSKEFFRDVAGRIVPM